GERTRPGDARTGVAQPGSDRSVGPVARTAAWAFAGIALILAAEPGRFAGIARPGSGRGGTVAATGTRSAPGAVRASFVGDGLPPAVDRLAGPRRGDEAVLHAEREPAGTASASR